MQITARLKDLDLDRLATDHGAMRAALSSGEASGAVHLNGTLENPSGGVQLSVNHLDALGQHLNHMQLDATVANGEIRVDHGRMQSGSAALDFSLLYKRAHEDWNAGQVSVHLDSNGFPLRDISAVNRRVPQLDAQLEAHGDVTASLSDSEVRPVRADGTILLRGITFSGRRYGTVLLRTQTSGQAISAVLSGDLSEAPLRGSATVQISPDLPLKADAQFGKLELRQILALAGLERYSNVPMSGFAQGNISLQGPLEDPKRWRSLLQLETLELQPEPAPSGITFSNSGPVVIETDSDTATVRSFHITGKDTNLTASGSIGLFGSRPLSVNVNGSADLRLVSLLDRKVDSSGESQIAASISGSLANPALSGTLRIRNGSFFFQNVTNGLTGVNGIIVFSKSRATIQTLTAQSGGGTIRLTGFVSLAARTTTSGSAGFTPAMLVYGLEARADKVRLRYAGGISVTADANLRLSGSSNSSLLSGTATVSRVALSENTDIGNVLANFAAPAPTPANQKDFVTGLHFDIGIESAPNLQLSTTLSRDRRSGASICGCAARPIAPCCSAAYRKSGRHQSFRNSLQHQSRRSNVSSTRCKIEPVLDLDLQTETRGITVDITIAGHAEQNEHHLSFGPAAAAARHHRAAYRGPRTLGCHQPASRTRRWRMTPARCNRAPTACSGQAISPTLEPALTKLFGITNIKIDPLVQGITNTPQARLTLEQQISRDITVTYVTNLSQTSEQIFRVEWSLNPQYSVVALRDENGEFGIDIQYKKRFK